MCAVSAPIILTTYPPESVPKIGEGTRELCQKKGIIFPDNILNIKERISELQTLQNTLTYSRDHATKEKIVSVLATSLALGLLAAGIFGLYYFTKTDPSLSRAITGSTIFTGALVINIILSVDYIFRWSDDDRECVDVTPCNAIFIPIIGACIPVYMTFGKISRLERSAQQGAQNIKTDLQTAKAFFESKAEPIGNLIRATNTMISDIQKVESSAKPLEIPDVDQALKNRIILLDNTTKDLAIALAFYQGIQP